MGAVVHLAMTDSYITYFLLCDSLNQKEMSNWLSWFLFPSYKYTIILYNLQNQKHNHQNMEITSTWVSYAAPLLATITLILLGRRRKLHLPPGPKPWPIIGNLNLMGELPHRSLEALSKKYGSLMQAKFGSHPVVVGSSVEMAWAILKTHDLSLAGRPKTASGKYTTHNYQNITWAPYGPYWRQARKLCLMELFSPKRLDQFEYIHVEENLKFLNTLFQKRGKPISVRDHFSDLSFSVISR